jgi:hypothetical protein
MAATSVLSRRPSAASRWMPASVSTASMRLRRASPVADPKEGRLAVAMSRVPIDEATASSMAVTDGMRSAISRLSRR